MSTCKHLSMTDMNKALLHAIRQKHKNCVDQLIAAGADVNTTDHNGHTALMLAGDVGATGCLDSLIKSGARTDIKSSHGNFTVLHFTAKGGHKECLELLLENGFEIDRKVVTIIAQSGHSNCLNVLIKGGLDVNGSFEPLQTAAEAGQVDIMELLIRQGGDVNLLRFGRTALHLAALRGHDSSLRLLIQSGADVNLGRDETPLILAARCGKAACVRTLINAGADVHRRDTGNHTALSRAELGKHHEYINLLVEAGVNFDDKDEVTSLLLFARGGIGVGVGTVEADVNAQDVNGRTALHSAVQMDLQQVVLDSLIKLGAKANIIDEYGYTPLLTAVQKEQINCVSTLISAGADVNYRSPLLEASKRGSSEIVKFLIDSGANVNVTDSHGNSPIIHIAKEGKDKYTIGLSLANVKHPHSHRTCLGLLLEAGADVNMANKDGSTALLQATVLGNDTSMKVLLQAGADVNKKDTSGMTALMYVARNRNDFRGQSVVPNPSNWMKLLLEAGVDVNIANKDGNTALMEAADFSGENLCLELLLKAKADVNIINRNSRTVLMMTSNKAKVAMLLDCGSQVNWANEVGLTALLYSAYNGRWDAHELAELLLEAGADVNAMDVNNSSILAHAARTTDRFIDHKLVKVALKHGVHVNIRNVCGQNSLEYYLAMGQERDEKLALLLLAAGELLDVKNARKVAFKLDTMGTLPLDHMDPNKKGPSVPVPNCLLDQDETICLKSLCRKVIRQHLLKIDLHSNLFGQTLILGLPKQLQRYLVYETTLDLIEGRCNLFKEEMNLLDPQQKACRICFKLHC